jgi:hypothetical protein
LFYESLLVLAAVAVWVVEVDGVKIIGELRTVSGVIAIVWSPELIM